MTRLALTLLLALAAGFCHMDHEQLATSAEHRIRALSAVADLGTATKTPEALDRLAAVEADAWRIVRARALGEPLPEGLRERVEVQK